MLRPAASIWDLPPLSGNLYPLLLPRRLSTPANYKCHLNLKYTQNIPWLSSFTSSLTQASLQTQSLHSPSPPQLVFEDAIPFLARIKATYFCRVRLSSFCLARTIPYTLAGAFITLHLTSAPYTPSTLARHLHHRKWPCFKGCIRQLFKSPKKQRTMLPVPLSPASIIASVSFHPV